MQIDAAARQNGFVIVVLFGPAAKNIAQRGKAGGVGARDQQRGETGDRGGDRRHAEREREPSAIADRRDEQVRKAVEVEVPADRRDP